MITHRKSASEPDHWASEQGDLRIVRPTPRVTMLIQRGHLDAAFARPIREALEASLARAAGRLFIFVDGDRLETYDPRIRVIATEWLREHRDEVAALHVLAGSRVARSALLLTTLMLGSPIVGHARRDSFQAALAEAIGAELARERTCIALTRWASP